MGPSALIVGITLGLHFDLPGSWATRGRHLEMHLQLSPGVVSRAPGNCDPLFGESSGALSPNIWRIALAERMQTWGLEIYIFTFTPRHPWGPRAAKGATTGIPTIHFARV